MPSVLPLLITPIAVFTYFWINPVATAAFVEGLGRFLIEVYLGYKAWKVESRTNRLYKKFKKQSERLAKQNGFEPRVVKLYFNEYGQGDERELYNKIKEDHERKHKNLEDAMRDFLVF